MVAILVIIGIAVSGVIVVIVPRLGVSTSSLLGAGTASSSGPTTSLSSSASTDSVSSTSSGSSTTTTVTSSSPQSFATQSSTSTTVTIATATTRSALTNTTTEATNQTSTNSSSTYSRPLLYPLNLTVTDYCPAGQNCEYSGQFEEVSGAPVNVQQGTNASFSIIAFYEGGCNPDASCSVIFAWRFGLLNPSSGTSLNVVAKINGKVMSNQTSTDPTGSICEVC